MTQLHIEDHDRHEHPLDIVERLASLRDWIFDRAETDEMSVTSPGRWTDYHLAFTWIEDMEALHVACAFDLKVPERQRVEEMFGSPGVVMPYGTETLRITLNTLASDRRAYWFFGTALT